MILGADGRLLYVPETVSVHLGLSQVGTYHVVCLAQTVGFFAKIEGHILGIH